MAGVIAFSGLSIGVGSTAEAQMNSVTQTAIQKEATMTIHAKGTFDVKVVPLANEDSAIGRLALDKQFHGDLEGTSKGQMLAAGTPDKGSAGYVAIEVVTGKLNGKSGTFVLQHVGYMKGGEAHMTVTVIPDSGTGELTGLSGTMAIVIEGKKHSYDFEYTLGS
jgi:hypothetical protein